jgi:hypothetical protein
LRYHKHPRTPYHTADENTIAGDLSQDHQT